MLENNAVQPWTPQDVQCQLRFGPLIPLKLRDTVVYLVNRTPLPQFSTINLHCMRLVNDPGCKLCSLNALGAYIHMFWDWPAVQSFWKDSAAKLSVLTHVMVPVIIPVLILNDLLAFKICKL